MCLCRHYAQKAQGRSQFQERRWEYGFREIMTLIVVKLNRVVPVVKNLPASAGKPKRLRFDPWIGKIPRRRARQPTPVFLPGESHGQRSLAMVHRFTESWTQLKWSWTSWHLPSGLGNQIIDPESSGEGLKFNKTREDLDHPLWHIFQGFKYEWIKQLLSI